MTLIADNRFLTHASWDEYTRLLDVFGDRPIRISYDRGRLEIMSPTWDHEKAKGALGSLILAALEENGIDCFTGGSTTFRRQDLDRGLEPDECYWVQSYARMVAVKQLDLERNPPPDLALEIEWTATAIDRMALYASLGVPEVWRFTRLGPLEVHWLVEGKFEIRQESPALAGLRPADLLPWVEKVLVQGTTRTLREFRVALAAVEP
jgi:Uma2 family endonuclease